MGSWRRLIRGLEGLLLLGLSRMKGQLGIIREKKNPGKVVLCIDRSISQCNLTSDYLYGRLNDQLQANHRKAKRQYASIHQ